MIEEIKKYLSIILLLIINNTSFATIINVPEDQPTIQAGIDTADSGDTVLVKSGTYVENINYKGKCIIVGSLFLTTQNTTYTSQTIIDGNQAGTAVTFENGEDSTTALIGFTVTNGKGGILCENGSSPRLLELVVTGNKGVRGAGIYCHGNSCPILRNVTISDNDAEDDLGGGLCCFVQAHAKLFNVTVSGNSSDNKGGGIFVNNSNITLESVKILNNLGRHYGGGIHCQDIECVPMMKNVTISNNTSESGGGISLEFADPILEDVIITDNTAGSFGGGIHFYNSDAILKNVIISNNTVTYESYSFGGGIYCIVSSPILENVIISNNKVYGSGLNRGGGIAASGYHLTIVNSVISQNDAVGGDDNQGDGIFCRGNLTFINSILWNNSPQGLYLAPSCSILIAFSDVQGGKEGIVNNDSSIIHWPDGNIDKNPLFKSPVTGDFHLTSDSPCVNKGKAFFEWQGDTLVNLSEDEYVGMAPDMGAYELEDVDIKKDLEFLNNNLALYHNYPNPFNSKSIIKYRLPIATHVSLKIYTMKGRLLSTLVDSYKQAGEYKVNWDSSRWGAGVYYIKLSTKNNAVIQKAIIIK